MSMPLSRLILIAAVLKCCQSSSMVHARIEPKGEVEASFFNITAGFEEQKTTLPDRRQKALTLLELLELYPCEEGCSGHGVCLPYNIKKTPPLPPPAGPTIHGSGCQCSFPPYAGPACEKECPSAGVNTTINIKMKEEETLIHVEKLSKSNPAAWLDYWNLIKNMPNMSTKVFTRPGVLTTVTPCSGAGDCHPVHGHCECNNGRQGLACQYDCPRALNFGNQVCSGTARGNCTWNETQVCHPLFPACQDRGSTSYGIRCDCRWDTRGHDCAIDCPRDIGGRICSNNGTCDMHGLCVCFPGVEGSYCQYGILNDTYVFQPNTPLLDEILTPRRFTAMTAVHWYWVGWDDERQIDTHNYEHLAINFGGVGQAAEVEIMEFDPKTRIEYPAIVTKQISYQQIFYWNHTDPDGRQWVEKPHMCFRLNNFGDRVIGECSEDDVSYYIPNKRSGHTLITLGDQKSVMLYGGYSSICADYCNDLWHFDLTTRIWTFLNMTAIPRTQFLTEEEYRQVYGLGTPERDYRLTAPIPTKRWLHTMCPVNETSLILFGGYYSKAKQPQFLNDIWVYTLNILPTPEKSSRFGENKGNWRKIDDSQWGTKPGTAVIPGRRAHAAAYINGKLYVYGGQIFSGSKVFELSGREYKSRSNIVNDMWEWSSLENQWRNVNVTSIDGYPSPRYLSASYRFKDCLIIQGGYDDPVYHDDMWVFNATVHSWTHMTYKHRNSLVFNPRPAVRYGHAMALVGDAFLIFGGYGQVCVNEAMGSPDYNPDDDADEDSQNFFCMPDLVKYPLGHELEGQIIWYDEITGQPTTDAAKMNAGATRLTTVPNYYGDTWLFNHTRCPESCNNHGFCNLNFCVCKHEMPQFCNNHMCVAPTFWGSFKPGTDKAQWGYHCGFQACANSSCYYNYTHQHEYCRHCQYHGFCNGFTGRCNCEPKHQHILPLHYQKKERSPYGEPLDDGTRLVTPEPVPFYAEKVPFDLDDRGRKDCQYSKCPHQFCNGHGYCMKDGRCHCHPEYIGEGCEYHMFCPQACNFQGICVPKLRNPTTPWAYSYGGDCACFGVFNGSRCQIALRNAATQTGSGLTPYCMSMLVSMVLLLKNLQT